MSITLKIKKLVQNKAFITFCAGVVLYLIFSIPEMLKYGGVILYNSDYTYMALPNFIHSRDAILSGNTNWDWSVGTGSQFIGAYMSQQLTPLYIINLIVPKDMLIYVLPYITAVKYGLGAMFAYFYIGRYVNNKHFAVIGGLMYMFSSFTGFTVVFNFTDIIAMFPLLLFSLDELCINNRRGLFAVCVALMSFQSIYFLFGQAVFCVIYYFIRCTDKDFKASVKQFITVAAEAVIGFGMSLIISLPTLLYLLEMPRSTDVMALGDMFFYHDILHYLKIFQSAFMLPDPLYYQSLFFETEQVYPFGTLTACAASYIPLFGAAGVISWIWAKRKTWQSRLLIICVVMAFVPILNSLFNALNTSYYARWFYMPLLIGVVVSLKTLEENISLKPGIAVSGIVLALFSLYWLFLEPRVRAYINEEDMPTAIIDFEGLFKYGKVFTLLLLYVPAVFLLILYSLQKAKQDKKSMKKLYAVSVFAVFATFVPYTLFYSMIMANNLRLPFAAELYKSLSKADHKYNEYRISTECRPDYNSAFFMSGSENVQNSWNITDIGNETFNTAVGYVINKASLFYDAFESTFPEEILSAKYYVTLGRSLKSYYEFNPRTVLYTEQETEDEEEEEKEPFYDRFNIGEAEEVYEYIYIQENLNYIPMGFTYDTMVSSDRFYELEDFEQRRNVMMKSIVVEDPAAFSDILVLADDEIENEVTKEEYSRLIERHRAECCDYVDKTTEGFTAHIDLEKENLVFFSASWNTHWTAYIDGEKADYYNVNCGNIGLRVPAGSHDIKLVYTTPGLTEGCIASAASAAALIAYVVIANKLKKKET